MVYFTRTSLPLCLPGFHFGIAWMTRTASASNASLTFLNTFTWLMVPSISTMNCTSTRPSMPFFMASSGYLTFIDTNFIISPTPPGNSGICSTTSKTPSDSSAGSSSSCRFTSSSTYSMSLITILATFLSLILMVPSSSTLAPGSRFTSSSTTSLSSVTTGLSAFSSVTAGFSSFTSFTSTVLALIFT